MLSVFGNVLLPLTVVVAVGYLLRRNLVLDLPTINRLAVYGLSPALIFVSLVRADLNGGEAARMVVLSVGLVAIMACVTLICARVLGVRDGDLSGLLLGSLFMNSGNYGLPLARFAFGEAGFQHAMLFFIPQSILAQTVGVAVAATGSTVGQTGLLRTRNAMRRVLRMPQIYAIIAALLVRATGLPLDNVSGPLAAIFRGLALLAEGALPLLLTLLGMQLAQGVMIEVPKLVALATGFRLLVSPLIAYGLALSIGLSGTALHVGVVQAAMPTAVNMTILALEFDAQPRLVVGTVIVSTVASLLTLSLILSIF